MDTVADEDPAALGLFEQVEVIGLVFEVHVCLDYKSHHDVEEADVVGEEYSNEEELPPEWLVTLNEPRDEDRPAFRGGQLIEEGQRGEDVTKILVPQPAAP